LTACLKSPPRVLHSSISTLVGSSFGVCDPTPTLFPRYLAGSVGTSPGHRNSKRVFLGGRASRLGAASLGQQRDLPSESEAPEPLRRIDKPKKSGGARTMLPSVSVVLTAGDGTPFASALQERLRSLGGASVVRTSRVGDSWDGLTDVSEFSTPGLSCILLSALPSPSPVASKDPRAESNKTAALPPEAWHGLSLARGDRECELSCFLFSRRVSEANLHRSLVLSRRYCAWWSRNEADCPYLSPTSATFCPLHRGGLTIRLPHTSDGAFLPLCFVHSGLQRRGRRLPALRARATRLPGEAGAGGFQSRRACVV